MKVLLRVIGHTGKETQRLFWYAMVCALCTAAINVYANIVFGELAADVIAINKNVPATVRAVLYTLVVILVLYTANAAISYFQDKYSDVFRYRALNKLRLIGYSKIQNLAIEYFSSNRPGTIVQKTTYVNAVVNWISDFTHFRIYNITIPLFSLIPLFSFHYMIGLVTLAGIVCTVVLQVRKTKYRKPHMVAGNVAWEEAVGVFTEHVSHMSTSRTTANQKSLFQVFNNALDVQLGHRMKQSKIEWIFNSTQLILEALVISAVLGITVLLAYRGSIGLAALVSVSAMIRNIMFNSRGISQLYDSYITSTIEGARFLELIDEPESTLNATSTKKLHTISEVRLVDVGFTYSDSSDSSLHAISLEIKPKQKIGLVGSSGGGKSTLAKLVMRLHAPTKGLITLNGEDINTFDLESIREQVGVVMQDVALYHISVADNVRVARPSASDKDVIDALKIANAWQFVQELPNGIETIVGERGIKLSGGQKQRIAIARAAIKKPSLIILDEATSALDSTAEFEVQKGLKRLMKNTMSLVVAHRLSTVRDCDEIIVLEKGSIVERGSHEELIKLSGRYSQLWNHQSGELAH